MSYTIFAHLNSAEDALSFFRTENAKIEGDVNNWEATFVFEGNFFQKDRKITFTYDKDWCSPPNWPEQIAGMENFVSSFEMDDQLRNKVLPLVRSFQYAIATIVEPKITRHDDQRLHMINRITEHLEACIFSPSALLDSHFRAFAAKDNDIVEGAVIPEVRENIIEKQPQKMEENSYESQQTPSATRVAKRMYVLATLAARGLLDMNLSMGNEPACQLEELHQWYESLNLEDEAESLEKTIIYTPIKKLSEQDMINSTWGLEALSVLAWSLSYFEIPVYDELVHTDKLLHDLSFLDSIAALSKIQTAELRSSDDLSRYSEEIFAYDWRMVDFRVNPKKLNFLEVKIGPAPFDHTWAKLIDGDLAIQGKRIDKANPNDISTAQSIAVERHKASNWLQGYAQKYSHITTDT